MALFRRVYRMLRRRLCLLFVLVWLATVFLCGLEVMKYKTTLKGPGLSSKTSKHYQFLVRRQHQRHRVAKGSRYFSLSDGFGKDHSKLVIDKDEDGILDKRFESHDGVPFEANNDNLVEYEKELDLTGIGYTNITIDSLDSKEDRENDEDGIEALPWEEQEQQKKHGEYVEEATKYGEEQEEDEFDKEVETEINESKQEGENQQGGEEEAKEDEKLQHKQNYESNVMRVQYEKYKKENTETNQENDYEEEDEDLDKREDEQEDQEGQEQGTKQEERNQNDEQGRKDGQIELEALEEQDDDEEDNYRELANQSEGFKSEQREETQTKEKMITQQYEESFKQDNHKEASMSRTQSFKMANNGLNESTVVPLKHVKRNDYLTVQDEDRKNEDNSSREERQDDKVTKDLPPAQMAQIEGSNRTQSAMDKKYLGTIMITSRKKDGKGDGAALRDKEIRDVTNVKEIIANKSYGEEGRRNISEKNSEIKEGGRETAEKATETEERVELHTGQNRIKGDVKPKENGYLTEISETINREARHEDKETKSTELAKQRPGKTDKNSHSDEKGLQGHKANKASVEMKRNKERQDEGHKNGNSVTETKGTAEPSEQANENGAAKITERTESEDEQGEGNMKYQDDKLNAEEQKQIYESKTKINDPGNEEKHNVKNESERSDETENGNESKENTDNQDRQGAVEEDHVSDKRPPEDVERYQAEAEIKSDGAGRPSSRNTLLPWTGQPTVSTKEQKHGGNSSFQKSPDHQPHGEETGHEQDSFESNKTNSMERNVSLAQGTTKPTMSEELLLRRQDERKLAINRFCQKQKVHSLPGRRDMENMVVIDQAKVVYCAIPKVASTEWREALSVELGHGRIRGKKAQNRTLWKHLNEYSNQNITEKLKYYKFLFVREPFSRLLSAYKSKFLAGNEYYLKTYGRQIIRTFRKQAKEHANNTGNDVTFLEFVKYISVTRYYDEHWRPYNDICHMCSVNYDFIGHLETIEEDAPFLLKELGIDNYVTFKSSRRSQTSSELLKYYSQIPAPYIKRLGAIYFKDFEMFGYPFPGPLKSIVGDST